MPTAAAHIKTLPDLQHLLERAGLMVVMDDTGREGTLPDLDPAEPVVDAEYDHGEHLLSGEFTLFPVGIIAPYRLIIGKISDVYLVCAFNRSCSDFLDFPCCDSFCHLAFLLTIST